MSVDLFRNMFVYPTFCAGTLLSYPVRLTFATGTINICSVAVCFRSSGLCINNRDIWCKSNIKFCFGSAKNSHSRIGCCGKYFTQLSVHFFLPLIHNKHNFRWNPGPLKNRNDLHYKCVWLALYVPWMQLTLILRRYVNWRNSLLSVTLYRVSQ